MQPLQRLLLLNAKYILRKQEKLQSIQMTPRNTQKGPRYQPSQHLPRLAILFLPHHQHLKAHRKQKYQKIKQKK
nr:hypothetical protein B7L51_19610 [Pectobacterium carotovorum]